MGAALSTSSLESLSMDANPLMGDGVAQIADGIKAHSRLRSLSLSRTQAGFEGLYALSKALLRTNSIQVLALAGNGIKELGARSVARSVSLSSLKVLCARDPT